MQDYTHLGAGRLIARSFERVSSSGAVHFEMSDRFVVATGTGEAFLVFSGY